MNRLTINIKGFDYRLVTESSIDHIRDLEAKLNAKIDLLCAKADVSLQDALVLIALNLMDSESSDDAQVNQMREEFYKLKLHCSRLEKLISKFGIDVQSDSNTAILGTDDAEEYDEVSSAEENNENLDEADTLDEFSAEEYTLTSILEDIMSNSDNSADKAIDHSIDSCEDTTIDDYIENNTDNPAEENTIDDSTIEDLTQSVTAEIFTESEDDSESTFDIENVFNRLEMSAESEAENTEPEEPSEASALGENLTEKDEVNINIRQFDPEKSFEDDMQMQRNDDCMRELALVLKKANQETEQIRKEVNSIRQRFLY